MKFKKELELLINKYSKENGSDTPDFILAEYLVNCLENFDKIVNQRNEWYSDITEEFTKTTKRINLLSQEDLKYIDKINDENI